MNNPGMTTSHRGLPLPPPLPESFRPQPPASQPHTAAHGYAPIPPQPAYTPARIEEETRNDGHGYYIAKAEEHKVHQEEERTRQQQLRLEQRKVEHDMLREAIRGGIPAHLVPSLFASLGGAGRYPDVSPIQHYQATMPTAAQQEISQPGFPGRSPPDLRRETRAIPQSHQPYYPAPGSAVAPSQQFPHQPPPAFNASTVYPSPATHSPRGHRSATVSGGTTAKHPINSSLPRLTTNEAQVQHPTSGPTAYGTDRASPSPSISFHHWQPPSTTSGGSRGADKTSPRQPTTLSSGESVAISSPRKRKDMRPHQAAPPPSYAPRERTPMSERDRPRSAQGQTRGHARHQSASQLRRAPYDPIGRPAKEVGLGMAPPIGMGTGSKIEDMGRGVQQEEGGEQGRGLGQSQGQEMEQNKGVVGQADVARST